MYTHIYLYRYAFVFMYAYVHVYTNEYLYNTMGINTAFFCIIVNGKLFWYNYFWESIKQVALVASPLSEACIVHFTLTCDFVRLLGARKSPKRTPSISVNVSSAVLAFHAGAGHMAYTVAGSTKWMIFGRLPDGSGLLMLCASPPSSPLVDASATVSRDNNKSINEIAWMRCRERPVHPAVLFCTPERVLQRHSSCAHSNSAMPDIIRRRVLISVRHNLLSSAFRPLFFAGRCCTWELH